MAVDMMKHTPPAEKHYSTPKAPFVAYRSASVDRPYACPYEGCGKAYIHEYKLNLHLRREHPGYNEEIGKRTRVADQAMDDASDQDGGHVVKGGANKNLKRSKPRVTHKMPATKLQNRKSSSLVPTNINTVKKQWQPKETYEEDSEETEEDRENADEDQWRYREVNEDDEETEDED